MCTHNDCLSVLCSCYLPYESITCGQIAGIVGTDKHCKVAFILDLNCRSNKIRLISAVARAEEDGVHQGEIGDD